MAYSTELIKCEPFTDRVLPNQQVCCRKMKLVPIMNNPLQCRTCHFRRTTPKDVIPIFPANQCADEHIANNHTILCLICSHAVFHAVWIKEQINTHVTECVQKATIGLSRPYICTKCFSTMWLK